MYPATCLRSASCPCMKSRTEGFAPLKMLYTTVPVFRPQVVFRRPVKGHKIILPCQSRVCRRMAAILAPVATLATRSMSPKLRNMILMPMRLKQNQMTAAVKSKNSTGGLIPTRGRWFIVLLISLVHISISCWILFDYSSFSMEEYFNAGMKLISSHRCR